LFYTYLNIHDIGGGFYIHGFGAAFGILASWIYSQKSNCKDNPNIKASYNSATLTFIGTFFLWWLFPFFNWINSNYYIPFNLKFLAIQNTFWALMTSTTFSFCWSMLVSKGKLWLDHIINSSISGAIIISSWADMYYNIWGPLFIGAIGGIISTLWYRYLSKVAEMWYLFDTRGIVNLHWIPALFGAIIWSITTTLLLNPLFGNPSDTLKNYFKNI